MLWLLWFEKNHEVLPRFFFLPNPTGGPTKTEGAKPAWAVHHPLGSRPSVLNWSLLTGPLLNRKPGWLDKVHRCGCWFMKSQKPTVSMGLSSKTVLGGWFGLVLGGCTNFTLIKLPLSAAPTIVQVNLHRYAHNHNGLESGWLYIVYACICTLSLKQKHKENNHSVIQSPAILVGRLSSHSCQDSWMLEEDLHFLISCDPWD